ncbi:hypothetical protein Mahau_1327 [Mahella australiensis 50-1 BON]|uniref:Uncharacterized protein n=1 Tax=Mahella australiensis (strain DSM 15567 / CIP 107919 / 50-1 BON) TaxID=697281 RepID=F3ZWS8_MAHA5|nr:hypothetical protein Mahau_1327 [Mahella australiensis 50-1 BON]
MLKKIIGLLLSWCMVFVVGAGSIDKVLITE